VNQDHRLAPLLGILDKYAGAMEPSRDLLSSAAAKELFKSVFLHGIVIT